VIRDVSIARTSFIASRAAAIVPIDERLVVRGRDECGLNWAGRGRASARAIAWKERA